MPLSMRCCGSNAPCSRRLSSFQCYGRRSCTALASASRRGAAAVVAQIRREFAADGEQVATGIERIAASDAILRIAGGIGQSKTDFVPYVGEAAPLAAAQALDFLDLVADSGTIISSAHWPAR